jgi:hypothetical protein
LTSSPNTEKQNKKINFFFENKDIQKLGSQLGLRRKVGCTKGKEKRKLRVCFSFISITLPLPLVPVFGACKVCFCFSQPFLEFLRFSMEVVRTRMKWGFEFFGFNL